MFPSPPDGETSSCPSALAVPTPLIFDYKSFAMLRPAYVDVDTGNLASCEMCALVSCVLWECARLDVVKGFAQNLPLR